MKSKTEISLDKEFEKLGVKPHIYHFTEDVYPFRAVTIVTEKEMTWKEGKALLNDLIGSFFLAMYIKPLKHQPASKIKGALEKMGYGVAICDIRDQFSRKQGRTIAKGRLLKHLKRND